MAIDWEGLLGCGSNLQEAYDDLVGDAYEAMLAQEEDIPAAEGFEMEQKRPLNQNLLCSGDDSAAGEASGLPQSSEADCLARSPSAYDTEDDEMPF